MNSIATLRQEVFELSQMLAQIQNFVDQTVEIVAKLSKNFQGKKANKQTTIQEENSTPQTT